MGHVRWRKVCVRCPVTGIANQRCRNMGQILACCIGAVVAGYARPGDNTGMEVNRGLPGRRSMAGIARLGCRNMGSVLGLRIYRNIPTAMASDTSTGSPGVTHRGRFECCVILVAAIALGSRRNMPSPGRFARRDNAVVATRTVSNGSCRMGIGRTKPTCRRLVAGVALSGRRHMSRRFNRGAQHGAVVTIRTQTAGASMGIACSSPERCGTVASIALRACADVICRFAQGIECDIATGMTGRAQSGRARMIHARRFEGCETRRTMTTLARRAGRNMAGRLGLRIQGYVRPAMASTTSTADPGMAHAGRCEGIEIGMTGIAEPGGWNVRSRLREPLARGPVVAAVAGMITHGDGGGQQGMILDGTYPPRCRRRMAIRTLGIRRWMRGRLGLGILRDIRTAVAGRTLRLTCVIHGGWSPGEEIAVPVASVASPRCRNVIGRLG